MQQLAREGKLEREECWKWGINAFTGDSKALTDKGELINYAGALEGFDPSLKKIVLETIQRVESKSSRRIQEYREREFGFSRKIYPAPLIRIGEPGWVGQRNRMRAEEIFKGDQAHRDHVFDEYISKLRYFGLTKDQAKEVLARFMLKGETVFYDMDDESADVTEAFFNAHMHARVRRIGGEYKSLADLACGEKVEPGQVPDA